MQIYGTSYRLTHLNKEHSGLANKVLTQAMAAYPDELKQPRAYYQMLFDEMHETTRKSSS